MDTPTEHPLDPFILLTQRLIILPTPQAITSKSYRNLYASLHADASFCQMGFGSHFQPRSWSDDETRDVIQTRDIARCWNVRGMGDFAVGLRPISSGSNETETGTQTQIQILKTDSLDSLGINNLDEITWVGYAGVRDGTTTSIPAREENDPPFPHWKEMVEIRYGVSPKHWGVGIAKEAAEAVMYWAVEERGVRRFIAETERLNKRSARALEKLGFVLSGTGYWKEPSEVEWEKIV